MFTAFSTRSTLMGAAILMTGSLYAQNTGPVTVAQIPAIHCSTRAGAGSFTVTSWSVGAANSISSPGTSGMEPRTQPAQLGAFNLLKAFDECSPALFQALVAGNHLPMVTITDADRVPDSAATKTAMTINLQDVLVSHYMLGDDASKGGPAETISLTYSRITITNLTNGSKFCWDVAANRSCP